MAPFGETVLSWRLARGLTQAELAAAARMSRPNLSAVERGDREVTLATLRRLAVALEVRPGLLVDGVLPGPTDAPGLSRTALERVAAAALAGTRPVRSREADLARRLRTVSLTRFHPSAPRPPRSADRDLLLLRGLAAPETIASLLDRMRDRSARLDRRAGKGHRR